MIVELYRIARSYGDVYNYNSLVVYKKEKQSGDERTSESRRQRYTDTLIVTVGVWFPQRQKESEENKGWR